VLVPGPIINTSIIDSPINKNDVMEDVLATRVVPKTDYMDLTFEGSPNGTLMIVSIPLNYSNSSAIC